MRILNLFLFTQLRITDMDSTINCCSYKINARASKRHSKGRWQCHFIPQDFPKQDTDVRYWAVTAINDGYFIEIGYDVEFSSDRVDEYWFSVTENEKVVSDA